MSYYDNDITVAQSCSNFRSAGTKASRYGSVNEGISCSTCKNWNGSECLKNSYDNTASRLGID